MTYEIMYGQLCMVIDQFHPDGRLAAVIYVHRSECRSWEA